MKRSIVSVVTGFLVIVVLSVATDSVLESTGVLPSGSLYDTGLLLLATAYRSIFSVFGCYVTARLAASRPMRHALALGAVGVVVSIVGGIVGRDLGPAWYSLGLAALALPLAWCGGKLVERRAPGHSQATAQLGGGVAAH
jgi:hypothetical protein